MALNVYLSGEIHTSWREEIAEGCKGLDVTFNAPVTDHDASDDCGVAIMGAEQNKFWHDLKNVPDYFDRFMARPLVEKAANIPPREV